MPKHSTSNETEKIYESLTVEERSRVDSFLRVFDLRLDEVSLEVGSDCYREVAAANGQLDLFGGDSE